ncbi:MAG: transglycosylase domain-containing protein [Actinomycetes bacterium]
MANYKKPIIRITIFLAGFGFILLASGIAYAYFTVKIPDPNAFVNSQTTIIQYADGSELGRMGSENRTIVKLANIPLNVRHAVMAAEDRNFYSERAFSPTGIARALWNNLKGGSLQGGSTITQQYAKTAFLTPTRSIQRKIKELVIAIKLENQFSKDQILENYLNTIYFGRGSYGIETAAEVYFGRTVDQLNVSQAAVLASILRSPGYYDPSYGPNNLKRLKARWQYVIDGMVKAKWLSPENAAKQKFPTVKSRITSGSLAGPKGYVMSWVQRQLNLLGFTDEQLQVGGYTIKTTLEKKAQEAAVDAVDRRTPAKVPTNLHIGLVSIRPGTGEIVALYGGKDFLANQFNNATQATTQAGSTFKPFALVAALEQGIPLTSVWDGQSPQVFDDIGKPYPVFNYGNEQYGLIDLKEATAESVNTIFVPLGIKVGPDKVVDVARRAGIPTSVAMVATPSVTLGVASPHVVDVASAFATFAAQGIYAKPFIVKEVLGANSGVLYEARVQAQQVFAADVMADLTSALQEVTTVGTAAAALADFGRPSAGKTGTTTDNASAWFSGYTPQLATSVAMFRDNASQSLNGIGGLNAVTGGSFPAKIWDLYMKNVLKGVKIVDFPPSADIGGLDPVSFESAVPTLDPALAVTPTPTPTKKTKAKQ